MIYNIPVEWTVSTVLKIEADSLESAINKSDAVPLPDDAEYVDGSFAIHTDFLEDHNKGDDFLRELEEYNAPKLG